MATIVDVNGVVTTNLSATGISTISGLTYPSSDGSSGQYLQTNGSGALSWQTTTNLTRGTAVATTSGTSIDFSSLPSGIRRIILLLDNVSTNGTSRVVVRIGTGGTVETSGYSGSVRQDSTSENMDTSFEFDLAGNASAGRQLTMFLHNITGNIWIMSSLLGRDDLSAAAYAGGRIALGGTLDIVRITTLGGTDTFDGGTANIFYEV